MAKSSGKKSAGTSSGKSGKPTQSTAGTGTQASATGEKRAYRRAPILVRAEKLATQIGKKRAALLRMTERWQSPDETEDQTTALNQIVDNLKDLEPMIKTIGDGVALLKRTDFAPKAGAPGRKALSPDDVVEIKEKHYDAVAHGAPNVFKVVSVTEKNVLIQNAHTDGTPFPIERTRVKLWSGSPATADASA